jgi:hypothetical protein
MTRLESTAKGGYYPFESKHHAAMLSYFAPSTQGGRLLDPCAGEGAALEALATGWKLTPYANEIDQERSAACVQRFGAVQAVQGDMAKLQATNGAFVAVWCNPLYGDNPTSNDRREFEALKQSWKWVQRGGYMIWVVYKHHIRGRAAEWLCNRVSDVAILGVPGLHLGEYDQVVAIFKVSTPEDPDTMFKRILSASENPEMLTVQTQPCYTFPVPIEPKSFRFVPDRISPSAALRLLGMGNAHSMAAFQTLLTPPPPQVDEPPVVRPRGGQIGLILAAGLFNGIILDTVEHGRVAIRSTTKSEEMKVREEHEGDGTEAGTVTREIFRTKPVTTITLITERGDVLPLVGDVALVDFIRRNKSLLMKYVDEHMKPLYDFNMGKLKPMLDRIRIKGRKLFQTQKHVIAACHRALEAKDAVLLVGEMGVGKSIMGGTLLASLKPQMKPGQIVVIMSPSHLVDKWQQEMRYADPMCNVKVVSRATEVSDFIGSARAMPGVLHVAVISKEMAKLGEGSASAVQWRKRYKAKWKKDQPMPEGETGPRVVVERIPVCPHCAETVTISEDGKDVTVVEGDLIKARLKCERCKRPLWQYIRTFSAPDRSKGEKYPTKNPRVPIADYIAERYPDSVYAFACDEIHECKDISTGQGQAMITLSQVAEKVIGLTGTLYGGVSSSLYGIEFVFNRRVRKEYPWKGGRKLWVRDMGVIERVIEHRPSFDEVGAYTGKRTYPREAVESAGISPRLVREILDHTVFVGLKDLGKVLPKYEEIPVPVPMDGDMQSEYDQAKSAMGTYLRLQKLEGDVSFMSTYLQTLLSYPSAAFRGEKVIHKYTPKGSRRTRASRTVTRPVTELKALGMDRIYPKERALLYTIARELAAGRKCGVFLRQTGSRDIQHRIERLIRDHVPGAKPFILHSTVAPVRRAPVLDEQVRKGTNVFLCNPELVKTGIDLVEFPTLIFYEVMYSLYTMSQASRRAWRLIQERDCRTYYLYYTRSMEERAVTLIAKKQQAAALLNGEAISGGLNDLSEGGDSLLAELAATISEETSDSDLAALFAENNRAGEMEISESAWAASEEMDTEPELQAEQSGDVFLNGLVADGGVVRDITPRLSKKELNKVLPKPAWMKRGHKPTLEPVPAHRTTTRQSGADTGQNGAHSKTPPAVQPAAAQQLAMF